MDFDCKFIMNELNNDNNKIRRKNYLNIFIKFMNMNVFYEQNFVQAKIMLYCLAGKYSGYLIVIMYRILFT